MVETDEWETYPTELLLSELEWELELNIIDGIRTKKKELKEI